MTPTTRTFTDLGSGTGRMVVTASLLHTHLTKCRGIELLESIHEHAVSVVSNNELPKTIELQRGSFTDHYHPENINSIII